jgi:hypothetical protein
MSLNKFIKKINLVIISHGFGKQTQFIESLLDGHSQTVQFPTNYKDYFLNLKSNNFLNAIDEFIFENPGYVYDIFEVHSNKYKIIDKSRIVPLIEDRDAFFFNKDSLEKIKKNKNLIIYHNFVRKRLNKKYKKKNILKNELKKKFQELYYFDELFKCAKSPYSLSFKKFKRIYLNIVEKKNFKLKFSKKNLLILLHYSLAIYLNKKLSSVRYIIFNLHDYTNLKELIRDFNKSYHISVAQDFKIMFCRNKFKSESQNEGVIQFSFNKLINIQNLLNSFRQKKNKNFVFFNEFINRDKKKFINTLHKVLKLKKEIISSKPTYLSKKSFGNSRNKKILNSFSIDNEFSGWETLLKKKEIFYLDYFFKNFFKIFKNKPCQNAKYIKPYVFFDLTLFMKDFLIYIFKKETDTQKQFLKSDMNRFSLFKYLRTPIKIMILYSISPYLIIKKYFDIIKINKEYESKKFNFKIYN